MQHLYEFVVTKKQTEEEKEKGDQKMVVHLMYKSESSRRNKVVDLIKKELHKKDIIKQQDIDEFWLKQLY